MLSLPEKASRGSAAGMPLPGGGTVSSGLSGSPPCPVGTLSDESDAPFPTTPPGVGRNVELMEGATPVGVVVLGWGAIHRSPLRG